MYLPTGVYDDTFWTDELTQSFEMIFARIDEYFMGADGVSLEEIYDVASYEGKFEYPSCPVHFWLKPCDESWDFCEYL